MARLSWLNHALNSMNPLAGEMSPGEGPKNTEVMSLEFDCIINKCNQYDTRNASLLMNLGSWGQSANPASGVHGQEDGDRLVRIAAPWTWLQSQACQARSFLDGAHMEAPETLTKADLSRHLMERLEFGKTDADLLVQTFLESIIASLRAGEGVELRGFGSFRLRDRRARMGRNPRSGESIQVPPKRVAYFKLGKELRSKLIHD